MNLQIQSSFVYLYLPPIKTLAHRCATPWKSVSLHPWRRGLKSQILLQQLYRGTFTESNVSYQTHDVSSVPHGHRSALYWQQVKTATRQKDIHCGCSSLLKGWQVVTGLSAIMVCNTLNMEHREPRTVSAEDKCLTDGHHVKGQDDQTISKLLDMWPQLLSLFRESRALETVSPDMSTRGQLKRQTPEYLPQGSVWFRNLRKTESISKLSQNIPSRDGKW